MTGLTMLTEGQQIFLSTVSALSREDRFCDIQIELSDGERKFNSLLLAALSPFFDAMLSSSMKEGLSGVVKLPTVSSEVFDAVIAYYVEGEGHIDEGALYEFVDASEMIQLPQLKRLCLMKMSETLVPGNCLRVWQLSRMYTRDGTLSASALQMIVEDFESVSMQAEFLNLSKQDMHSLFRQDGYIIPQNHILEAVLRWIDANKPEEAQAVELFKDIKLPLIEPVSILKILCIYRDTLRKYKAVEDILKEYVLHGISPMHVGRRREHDMREVVVVCSSSNMSSKIHVHVWDLRQKQWFDLSTFLSGNLTEFAAAVVDCKIILSGGRRDTNVSSSSYIFDTKTGQWSRGSELQRPRCRHSSVSVLSSVYIVGGCSSVAKDKVGPIHIRSYLNSIEKWSPERNIWQTVGNLPSAVANACVVASGRYILTIGGEDKGQKATDDVQCFDVDSKFSFVVHHLPAPAGFVRGDIFTQYIYVVVGDNIYVLTVGDHSENLKVKTVMSDMKLPSSLTNGYAVVVLEGKPTVYTSSFTKELNLSKSDLKIGFLPTVPAGGYTVECAFRARIANTCYLLQ